MDEIAKTYNYRVLISDGSGTIVYSSEGEKSLMYKSLWNILNENLDKINAIETVLAQFFIIILNYIFSKVFIFKK